MVVVRAICYQPYARSPVIHDEFFGLDIVLGEAAAEALLLGKIVGVVQGGEVGDPFFCLVTRIGVVI